MKKLLKSNAGFTLIELMIVVIIIGILADLAATRYAAVTTKTKQTEAPRMLRHVHTMQQMYRAANDRYFVGGPASGREAEREAFAEINVDIEATSRYTYTIVGTAITYTCTAVGDLDGDAARDRWTITQAGVVINNYDDVIETTAE